MSKLFSDGPVLGIIGGMGPMASAYFQRLVVEMTRADTDQEHIQTILLNLTTIPDRTAFILGNSDKSPVPSLKRAAELLKSLGADNIAVTCVTSHCFYDEVVNETGVNWIHAVRELTKALNGAGVKKAGILATSGTVATGLFQREFEKAGISWEIPDDDMQREVMHIIYDEVKAGKEPDLARFERVVSGLREKGCETCILGCTELSLIKRDFPVQGVTDILEVLAAACIEACGKETRKSLSLK